MTVLKPLSALRVTLTSCFVVLTGLANFAHGQGLLPGKDLATAKTEAVQAHDYFDLAGAQDAISNDVYGLFFQPPRYEYEWSVHTQNYRLLLALSEDSETRGVATVLAAAAALNADRDDHAEALALEAMTLVEQEMDRRLAHRILEQVGLDAQPDYSNDMRSHIWTLSRQIGIFGPTSSSARQEGDFARLCLSFSRPVAASNRVDFRDLVTLSPAPQVQRFTLLRGGRDLCVVGAAFEQTYTMTIQDGLTSQSGQSLREPVSVTLTTPTRRAEVRLPGQGYVLPASGAQLIPVETVNLESLKVGLYHLEERNIGRMLRQGVLSYSPDDIAMERDSYGYIIHATGAFRKQVRTVFEGVMDVEILRHQRREDGLSFASMIENGPIERGLYLLTVQAPDRQELDAIKWLMVSDLAITTVDTPNGLFVTAIDTRSGKPVTSDVSVTMVTRANREMQPSHHGDQSVAAVFAAAQLAGKDGDEPHYLYASHPELGDSFIALGRAPIEIDTPSGLSPIMDKPLNLWAKADRGVYREGETARVVGLLRQSRLDTSILLPKTLHARLINPSGDVVEQFDVSLKEGGGFEVEVSLPFGARQGRWSLDFALGETLPVLRSVALNLTDFVPPSVELAIQPLRPLGLNGSDTVNVHVDYLYGAPASNLEVQLRGKLKHVKALGDFSVGLVEEEFVFAQPIDLIAQTNKQGSATFTLPATSLPDQTAFAAIDLEATVTDSAGRVERTSQVVALDSDRVRMGLRAEFDADVPVAENSRVGFTAAALSGEGVPVPASASWTLYREVYDYTWYFDGGRWNYESSYVDLPVSQGTLDLREPADLSVDVDWGAYRLELVSEDGLSASSLRFNAGWRALPQVDRVPGRLGVTLAGSRPKPGEAIDLIIDAPHEGSGQAFLIGSETQVIDLGALVEGPNTVRLDLPENWPDEAGLWVLPVVYSAGAIGADQLPGRSVGAFFVGFDAAQTVLDVQTILSPETRPREAFEFTTNVGALEEGESGYVLAWLVDDSVLRMSGYQSPNPTSHFLSAYALPADLRDTFAAMIASVGLTAAPLKQGFDGEFAMALQEDSQRKVFSLAQGLTTRIRETLALSSTIVPLDAQGRADLSLAVPDFVGRARLMTVSWTDQGRIGSRADTVVIRDPIVADLFLPRFLAPNDEVDVKLLLSNTQSNAIETNVTITPSDGLELQEGAASMQLSLAAEGQQTIPLRVKAGEGIGAAEFVVRLAFGHESLQRTFPIEIRPAAPRRLTRQTFLVEPRSDQMLDSALLAPLDHSTIRLSITPANEIDAAALTRSLEAYPYTCTEQTTSRALALLLGQELTLSQSQRDEHIRAALVRLQNRRSMSGLVSLWSGYSDGDLFLHALVSDFLALAEAEGVKAAAALRPDFITRLKRGVERAKDPYYSGQQSLRAQAYALAVLAQAGTPDVAAQRLLFDDVIAKSHQTFAAAALAAAAHAIGDTSDRDALLDLLSRTPKDETDPVIEDFGTPLRDQIATLALLLEAGLMEHQAVQDLLAARLPTLIVRLNEGRLSTQEQAWALRLSHQLGREPVAFTALGEDWSAPLKGEDFNGRRGIRNTGDTPLLLSIWQSGTPRTDTALDDDDRISLTRTLLDLETLEPLTAPAAGQRVLVSLTGTAWEDQDLDYILADLLPAGFEVEHVGLPETVKWHGGRVGDCGQGETTNLLGVCLINGSKAFQQTGNDYAEARADRVLIGFNTAKNHFAHYYVMRRTQSGTVTLPSAVIEAMYAPDIQARIAPATLR